MPAYYTQRGEEWCIDKWRELTNLHIIFIVIGRGGSAHSKNSTTLHLPIEEFGAYVAISEEASDKIKIYGSIINDLVDTYEVREVGIYAGTFSEPKQRLIFVASVSTIIFNPGDTLDITFFHEQT